MALFGTDGKAMNEFDVIGRYFAPLSKDGLINDAAVIDIPPGHQLVVTSDTLNAGTHFMADARPDDIAHKALRVNISDLYAMGATPLCYQLNIAYPEKPTSDWLESFTHALSDDQKRYELYCSGGDTTTIMGDTLSVSITALGVVHADTAWPRDGARAGDAIVVQGTIGDAWIGLQVLRGELKTDDDAYFIGRYYKPEIKAFHAAIPSAAIDISDGFIADLTHICERSNIGAVVEADQIPVSDPARRLLEQGQVSVQDLITGGDDYALVLAIPQDQVKNNMTVIGTFTGTDILVNDAKGVPLTINSKGWTHF